MFDQEAARLAQKRRERVIRRQAALLMTALTVAFLIVGLLEGAAR